MIDKWLIDFLFLFDAIIMLRGGNMWFCPAIFIWLVFAQSFFKFHKNGDIRKLKAWSFRLWKNDFCRLNNERARALQSSITIFWDTLYSAAYLVHSFDCLYSYCKTNARYFYGNSGLSYPFLWITVRCSGHHSSLLNWRGRDCGERTAIALPPACMGITITVYWL